MDKAIRITTHDEQEPACEYWLGKSPEERIAALEFLRKQYMISNHVDERLQRVCHIVERKRG
jgi:hypothetical protein